MKKLAVLFLGLSFAISVYSQQNLSLNLCGTSGKISFSKIENCRSINVSTDGYKVYGFVTTQQLLFLIINEL